MARLGDKIDSSSTDSGDYIILKSGRKIFRKSMDDAEWSAFVADAEKQGKVKLEVKSDDVVDDVQLPTVESVKAAMAAKKDKVAIDTSDLPAETRTVEAAGEEEAAKSKTRTQRKTKEPKVDITVGELRSSEQPPAPPPPLEDEEAQPPNPEPLEKQKSWVGFIRDADGGVKQQEMSDEMIASAPAIYGEQFIGHAPKGGKKFIPAPKEPSLVDRAVSSVPAPVREDLSNLYDKAKNVSDFVGESAQDLVKGAVAVGTLPQTLVQGAVKTGAEYLFPNTMGVGGEKLSWDKVNNPAVAVPGGPTGAVVPPVAMTGGPTAGSMAPPAAVPGGPSSSMSMKMSRSGGGKARPAAAMPMDPFAAEQALLNKQSKETLDFVTEETKNYKEAAGEYKKARIEAMKAVTDTALLEKQSMQRQMDEQQSRSDKYNEALEEVRRVSAQGVDPGRFWNNKDAGQKAAAVIAGALFGFTGQGMQWLNRLDNLVAEDVRQQEGDMARRIGGLEKYASGQLTLSDRARQAGIDERSMLNIDKAARFEELKMQMENMAAVTQDMTRKSQLMGMSQAIGDKQAALFGEMREYGAQAAMHKDRQALEWAKLNQQKEEFAMSQANKAAGGGGTKLEPGEKTKLDNALTGYQTIKQIMGVLGPEQGIAGATYDQVTKAGGQLSEAGRRAKAVEPLRRVVIRLLDSSAIQKADAEYWKDKISNVGWDNMSQADLRALMSMFANTYNSTLDTNARAGSNVSGFAPLESGDSANKFGFQASR